MSPTSMAQTVTPPMNSAPITGPLTATVFRDVAQAVSPAVVNIRTESRQRAQDLTDFFGGGGGGGGGDLFERFFGQPNPNQQAPQQPRDRVVQAAGTGFIIDEAGYILTNNHVVEGATTIAVSLYGEDDDREYAARVVGRDPLTDSALIELTEKPDYPLPAVKFGDSSQNPGRGTSSWRSATRSAWRTRSASASSAPSSGRFRFLKDDVHRYCRPTRPSIPATRAGRC